MPAEIDKTKLQHQHQSIGSRNLKEINITAKLPSYSKIKNHALQPIIGKGNCKFRSELNWELPVDVTG